MFAEHVLEARGVEHRARPDDAVRGQPREFERHVGEDIDRIRHDEQDAGKAALRDLRHDRLEDAHVLADQVKARFTWLLVRACRDNHDAGVGDVGVITRVDVRRRCERHAMRDVERLALGAVVVNIDQHHFGEQPALHQRKCGCGSHEPASHDANFAEICRPRACLGAVCHEPFSFIECRFAIVPQNGRRPRAARR